MHNNKNLLIFDISIKLLIVIFSANIISMIALNAFTLSINAFILIYSTSLLFSIILVKNYKIDFLPDQSSDFYLTIHDTNNIILFCIILSLLLTIPRWSYLIESFIKCAIHPVCDDDYWHIQELNSLINTPRYPAQSSFIATKYLSHYYAPWLITVFIYKLLHFNIITIKFAFSLVNSIYVILIINSIIGVAIIICKSKQQLYLLIYLLLLHAGIESMGIFWTPWHHHEWWMQHFAGFRLQISSFVTLSFWVIHHLSAAIALVFAGYIFYGIKGKIGRDLYSGIGIISLLLVYAFYSSLFVCLGAIPFLLYLLGKDFYQDKKFLLPIVTLSSLLCFPILWIYLAKAAKEHQVGFIFLSLAPDLKYSYIWKFVSKYYDLQKLNYIIFFLLCFILFLFCMIGELLAQFVIIILVIFKKINILREDVVLLALSTIFIISLFFISFSGGNNYAMRGAIIPIAIFSYIAAKYGSYLKFQRSTWFILFILLSLGSLNEIGMNFSLAVNSLKPPEHEKPLLRWIYKVNTDRNISRISQADIPAMVPLDDNVNRYFYLIEKMIGDKKNLRLEDREIMSDGPVGIWKYQDWLKK